MTLILEHKLFSFYTALVSLIVLVALFAPYLTPQDPLASNMQLALQPSSAEH